MMKSQPAETTYQLRSAEHGIVWGQDALEKALRAQPDEHVAAALRDALCDVNAALRKLRNVSKWLATGAAR